MEMRKVEYVTSNEDHVRLKIFDGDLKIDDAAADLIRIERQQKEHLRREKDALTRDVTRLHKRVLELEQSIAH